MFGGNTRNLDSAASYKDCARLFETPPLKNKGWSENERPLGNKRQWHYRVEKHGDTFKVMLYHTPMAEYSLLPDGGRRTRYTWDRRKTSTSFMWSVVNVGYNPKYTTTDGRQVRVPLVDAGWASLVFDKDGRLILASSDHGDTHVLRSNAEDKAKRGEAKRRLQVYIDAALTRADSAGVPNVGTRMYSYAPFTSPDSHLLEHVCLALYEGTATQAHVGIFMEYADAAWEWLHGSALYDKKPPPTLKQLEAHLKNKYLRLLGFARGSEYAVKPKFPVC